VDDLRDFLGVFVPIVAVCVLLVVGIVAICNRIEFGPQISEIESLRANAANVDPQQAEDVIGQVVEINRTIASNRAWNKVPFICILVPNGWDKVEPIPVPKVTP